MPRTIDAENMYVDDLPGIWSPVQWELSEAERIHEMEQQARASLLWAVDVPEAVLRLLLDETDVERAYQPPKGYDPKQQGEWDESLITFKFKRHVQLEKAERENGTLVVEYKVEDLGYWLLEVGPDGATLERI